MFDRLLIGAGLLLAASAIGGPVWANGAIAHGDGGDVGISYNYNDQRDADRRARDECGRRCDVVLRFNGQCAAIATARGGAWGAAARDRMGVAEDAAVDLCRSHGGRGCSVEQKACDR